MKIGAIAALLVFPILSIASVDTVCTGTIPYPGQIIAVCHFEDASVPDIIVYNLTNNTVVVINGITGRIKWQKTFSSLNISPNGLIPSGQAYGDKFAFEGQETSASPYKVYILGSTSVTSGNPLPLSKKNIPSLSIQSSLIRPVEISYEITSNSSVKIEIITVDGKLLKEINIPMQKAGQYSLSWDGKNESGERVAAGIYYYVLSANDYRAAKKGFVFGY
jgi:hypothetical protein